MTDETLYAAVKPNIYSPETNLSTLKEQGKNQHARFSLLVSFQLLRKFD